MQANVRVQQKQREEKMVFYAVMVSLLLHVVFFALFVVLPEFTGGREPNLQPIHVRIVGGGSPVAQPAPAQPSREITPATVKPELAVEPVYIPPPAPQTILPSNYGTVKPDEKEQKDKPETTPEVKTLASRTQKPANATRQVEKIEHELRQAQKAAKDAETAVNEAQANTSSVASAIEEMRQRQAAGGSGTGTGTGHGPGSGSGSGVGGPLDIYLGIIIPIIEKNWSFSPAMFSGSPRMEVIISVKILPNGDITDMQFAKKSGNDYLDESGFKALAKSTPLPAFAGTGLRQPVLPLNFRFTPQGLQY